MLNSRKLKWLMALVLSFLTGTAIFTSMLIVERQQALERVSHYNLTWVMSQGANETLRLLEAVSASAVPGSEVGQAELELRLNMLASRLAVLREGDAAQLVRALPDLEATVAMFEQTLADVPALISALPDRAAARDLRLRLEPLVSRMLEMAAESNRQSGQRVAADQGELSHLHWKLAKLMAALILCVLLLVGLICVVGIRMMRSLQHSKDAADAANAAKSQFLANISHELRTPLSGVLGMIDLIILSDPSPTQRRYAETAQNAGSILFAMITEILHFATIESTEVELDAKPCDIRALVGEVADILDPQVQQKALRLSIAVASDVPAAVLVDASRLRQILLNLLGNAVKFTQAGQIDLSVACDLKPDGHCMVRIAVRDTGIGIPADKLDSIFAPFIQVDGSNTRSFGGVGLGLSIVQNLVHRMAGRIDVESTEGVGSVFRVALPLKTAERPACTVLEPTDEVTIRRHEVRADAEHPPQTGRPRVLLVDDMASSREVSRLFLLRAGCTVDIAENGLEAIERCAALSYDVIFMDRHMPVMDGIEATRRLRAREALGGARTRIIGLSAGALDEERASCLTAGMDDYLTKPVRMARIAATIDTWRNSMQSA